LNELSETLPEVRVRIQDARLRAEVIQCLARAGVSATPAAPRGQHAGGMLVCEASYLTRGAARGRGGLCGAGGGEAALPATLAAVAAGQLAIPTALRATVTKPVLTTREKQILALVVMGFSNREIADQLFLAESTVKSHLFSAFRRLGVRSRKEATALILDAEDGLGRGILAITQ
jgi:DNA-binding CsgD family transcriptional regulator